MAFRWSSFRGDIKDDRYQKVVAKEESTLLITLRIWIRRGAVRLEKIHIRLKISVR